jgi:hypothetical protein
VTDATPAVCVELAQGTRARTETAEDVRSASTTYYKVVNDYVDINLI